jgi:hypothetical protein
MKKLSINHYSLFILLSLAFTACQPKETTSFQYNVDKFYDLEILRYDVPEFDSLSLQQKQLIYCLSEAALAMLAEETVSSVAENDMMTKTVSLHKEKYSDIREHYGLKAQLACSVSRTVTAKYKTVREQLYRNPWQPH